MIRSNEKGFTLVELLLVLGLVGIVISLNFSFFFSNYRTFNREQDKIDIQNEAQNIMNYIEKKAIGCEKITVLEDEGGSKLTSNSEVNMSKITFSLESEDNKFLESNTFEVNEENKVLYGKGNQADDEIGQYVKSINVSPIESDFSNTKRITVTINLQKNGETESITNEFYFRNAN